MLFLIILGFILLILIPLYCCVAYSTNEDREQDDELQLEFIKHWKNSKSSAGVLEK